MIDEDFIGMTIEEITDERIKVAEECELLDSKRKELETERDNLRKRLIELEAEIRNTTRYLKMRTELYRSYCALELEDKLEDDADVIPEGTKRFHSWVHWYID